MPDSHPLVSVLCISCAGGGASQFRNWQHSVPDSISILAVQLPGREDRFRERPYERLDDVIYDLAEACADLVKEDLAIFGHSLGGLIGFELAREFRRRQWQTPVRLFVSSVRSPELPNRHPPLSRLPRSELLKALDDLGGMSQEMLHNRELIDFWLPSLRADLGLFESYKYRPEPPLDCPISAFGSISDVRVLPFELTGWRDQTKCDFRLRYFPGNHFFLRQHGDCLVGTVSEDLQKLLKN